MFMKQVFEYGFLVALVLGTVFLWQSVPVPCEQPIQYALGTFDPRFGITEEDFLKEVASAERLWEGALGKELFQYVPGSRFRVNLIFDDRQQQTLDGQKLGTILEITKSTQGTLVEQQGKVREEYDGAVKAYEQMLSLFKKHLSSYNGEVEKWNKQGGAPPEEYQNLQAYSVALRKSQSELEQKRQAVNALAIKVNTFSKKQVMLVEGYNDQVEEFMNRYGAPGEFDQGEYVDSEINIYQYDDLPHLEAVLVHEFGHALGLAHGIDSTSIMYRLMKDQTLNPLTLSTEDKTMLLVQCQKTVWDVMQERVDILKNRSLSTWKP